MIVVAGAGPAGLAAALGAARRGHEVTLLEASPVVGGMAASFDVAGIRVDHGSHRLHPAMTSEVRALIDEVVGDRLQVRERHGRLRLGGRWVGFPLRAGELARGLPRPLAAQMAIDSLLGPARRERADTFAEVVRAGLGPTVLREFYGPYAEKLWGRPAGELAGELARRRISASTPGEVLRKVVRARRPSGRTFLYPTGGFGTIVERLANAAVAAGVDVRLGSAVTGLDASDGGVRVVAADGRDLDAAMLWSTLPLPVLVGLLDPAAPMPAVEHRGMVLVYLVLDGQPWTPFDAHYLPGPETIASRISEPTNYRDDPADPTRRTVLCVEVPATVGDAVWESTDSALAARLVEELPRLDLPPVEPVEIVTRHLPRVYPVLPAGTDPVDQLDRWLAGVPNVISLGRQGRVTGDNTHHVLAMGLAAARCLNPGGTFDTTRWSTELATFDQFVVED